MKPQLHMYVYLTDEKEKREILFVNSDNVMREKVIAREAVS